MMILEMIAHHIKFFFRVTITATMADRLPPDLHLFRTYKSPQETLGINDFENPELPSPTSCHASDQLVWKAARASGAAPSFFRPEGNFVDGGIISNNPSLDLLTEIAEYNVSWGDLYVRNRWRSGGKRSAIVAVMVTLKKN